VWRSFELDPTATSALFPGDGATYVERLAAKYGMSSEQARQAVESTTATAAGVGLDFHMDRALAANTFDAHRVIHLAARGVQAQVTERLMHAHFVEGAAVGNSATLVGLASEAGLEGAEVERVLQSGEYADAVRADEAEAATFGIRGVPFFVLDRRYGVSGAQPAEHLLAALEQAWADREPVRVVNDGSGGTSEACGPDGCPI
ncbi:MAG TPA: DsbA family oxidoreductase, partial [Nocardioidaceae bacterium]|nr:DsbA family oxidoreductase [Nocardioidaceae bacterium]